MSTNRLPMLLDPLELCLLLEGNSTLQNACIVDLCSNQSYQAGHIPGAVNVPVQALILGTPPTPGKLPDQDQLERLFSFLGHTDETHYIVYDDEGGGWAGRFIWTLDVIGHKRFSYVDGGLLAWRGEGLNVSQENVRREPTFPTINIDHSPIAEKEDILAKMGQNNFTIWDARSPEEYRGDKVFAARGGHIPGAINCEWTSLMDPDRHFRLREDAAERLGMRGIRPGQDIITHCQSHHRSGFTYLVGRILDLNIRAYHGSWAEWGNDPNTPVEVTRL